MLHIRRPINGNPVKANNWVSLTEKAVTTILEHKNTVLNRFRWTLCGDEYFVPYLLENAKQPFEIHYCEQLLFNDFGTVSRPRELTMDDYDFLIHSDYLFARKFSHTDMKVVDKILQHIKR
jgi:hypothetical protein